MVRLSKGMPASRVRGSNEERGKATIRSAFFQLTPERTPFAPPPHFMKVSGGGGGTRASLVGLVGEEAFLERFLLLIIIIIIKSILRSAQQKKEGQMTFLFKFLAGLRGLEPRLTGPESVVMPIER